MLLKRIHLQNFRNIEFAALSLSGKSQFFLGQNAQGKTNLVEAISLLTALRSFRTQDHRNLIRYGSSEAQILYFIEHPVEGEMQVLIKLTAQHKELLVNEIKINRLSDFMGMVPVAVLSSEDMQILRGTPGLRRRFLDLTLSTVDREYFEDLRRYYQVIQERNALLRQYPVSKSMIEAYNTVLAPLGFRIYQKRAKEFTILQSFLREIYDAMVEDPEEPEIIYKPDSILSSSAEFLEILNHGFERDCLLKSTQRGPHRDDFELKVKSKIARQYASEGQQRGLVIALRLMQVRYFKHYSGLNSIILVDDILAQLDSARSEAFWGIVDMGFQIIGTGTIPPSKNSCRDWQVFNVSNGSFDPQNVFL